MENKRNKQSLESLAKLRDDVELGWQQSEAGDVVDGPSVFAEIREMSKAMRARDREKPRHAD
jgi:hypothetical protein